MKKLASLILAGLMTVAMIAPAAAADSTDVLKGTPEIDGVLDEIYLQSASQTLGPDFYHWGGDATTADLAAQSYFLWDDDYLYVCVVVEDDDVIDIGEQVYVDDPFNWEADATELWFDEGNGKWKTHGEAHGYTFFVQGSGGEPSFTTEDTQSAMTITDTGYITEYAMPVANLEVDGSINMSMQVNDMITHDAHPGTGYASGSQSADITLTFVADEVTYPEPETEAPVVEEVVEEATAPATFDAGIIAAVAAIVSAAGYAISKKR